jgi:tetratricopeptide (TPR) repeat protein
MSPQVSKFPRTRSALQFALATLISIFLSSPLTKADVIYFTNGSVLIVEKAWQDGDVTKYQTSRGIETTPSSTVRKIEIQRTAEAGLSPKYGIAVSEPSAAETSSRPLPAQLNQVPGVPPAISNEALKQLRANLTSDPQNAAARNELVSALNAVAILAASQGDFSAARSTLDEAIKLDRRNPVILSNLALTEYRVGNFRAAEELLLSCVTLEPENQSFHLLLGEAYYAQDKLADAINQWNQVLRLGPSQHASERLERATKELNVHKTLGTLQSAHFILRYDHDVSDYRLGQQILTTLESLYRHLSNELVSQPPATIAVIVYPDQAYFDVTQVPSWAGGHYDGKIRLPIKGLASVTPELSLVLVHELTHSFISSLPGRGCPTWFHEGLAQLEEGRSVSNSLQKQSRLIPLKELTGSLVMLNNSDAGLAYLESLSALEYLTSLRGRSVVRGILDLMAKNYSFENAFRAVTQMTVSQFETSWEQALSR